MKLVRIDFHNFRSCCDRSKPPYLKVAPRITCLMGASESGKSNLLEAMAKFEEGGFSIDDVPRSQLSPSTSRPDADMPMISATYELEEGDVKRLDNTGLIESFGNTPTFRRNYTGPIYLVNDDPVTARSRRDIALEILNNAQQFEDQVKRYLRAYSRARRSMDPKGPLTSRSTIRLSKFLAIAADAESQGHEDRWAQQLRESFNRLSAAIRTLPASAKKKIAERTRTAGETALKPESTEGGRRVSVLKQQEGAPVLLG